MDIIINKLTIAKPIIVYQYIVKYEEMYIYWSCIDSDLYESIMMDMVIFISENIIADFLKNNKHAQQFLLDISNNNSTLICILDNKLFKILDLFIKCKTEWDFDLQLFEKAYENEQYHIMDAMIDKVNDIDIDECIQWFVKYRVDVDGILTKILSKYENIVIIDKFYDNLEYIFSHASYEYIKNFYNSAVLDQTHIDIILDRAIKKFDLELIMKITSEIPNIYPKSIIRLCEYNEYIGDDNDSISFKIAECLIDKMIPDYYDLVQIDDISSSTINYIPLNENKQCDNKQGDTKQCKKKSSILDQIISEMTSDENNSMYLNLSSSALYNAIKYCCHDIVIMLIEKGLCTGTINNIDLIDYFFNKYKGDKNDDDIYMLLKNSFVDIDYQINTYMGNTDIDVDICFRIVKYWHIGDYSYDVLRSFK